MKVTPRPKDYGYGSKEAEASTLLDTDGNRLDPAQVRALPGFAAFVDASVAPPRVEVYCTDPEAHGYTRTRRTSYVPASVPVQRAREQAERQAYLQALQVAATVRQDFLATTYGTLRGAKRVQLDALRAAVTDPAAITVSDRSHLLLTRLAGCGPEAAEAAGTDRLTRLLVARWLTAAEANLERLTAGHWQVSAAAGLAYLDRLTAAGYVLCDAETRLRATLTEQIAAECEDDELDDEDDDAEHEAGDEADDEADAQPDEADQDSAPAGEGPDIDTVPVTVVTDPTEAIGDRLSEAVAAVTA